MSATLENVGQVIGFAIIALAPWISSKAKEFFKKRGDYFSANLRIRRQIDDIVKEIRIHIDCNRAALCEFSNTDKSTAGFPFEYVNMTYESTDGNVVRMKEQLQKRHVSIELPWLSSLDHENIEYYIFQNDDSLLHEDIQFRIRELALSTVIMFKLNAQLKYGYIAIHFVQPYMEDWSISELRSRLHDDHVYLKFQAKRIMALMHQLKK